MHCSLQAHLLLYRVYLVTDKNNPNIRITRDNNGNIDSPYDPMKLEVFSTEDLSGVNAARWGARTGYSLVTDVDYIIYKNYLFFKYIIKIR